MTYTVSLLIKDRYWIIIRPLLLRFTLTKSTDPVTCYVEFESSCQSNCNRRCGHTFDNDAKEEQHEKQLPNANVNTPISFEKVLLAIQSLQLRCHSDMGIPEFWASVFPKP